MRWGILDLVRRAPLPMRKRVAVGSDSKSVQSPAGGSYEGDRGVGGGNRRAPVRPPVVSLRLDSSHTLLTIGAGGC